MAKSISYINTEKKTHSGPSSGSSQVGRPYSPGSYGGGMSSLTMKEVSDRMLPVIAENYVDAQKEFEKGSYLYNPSFSNDAEGWVYSRDEWGFKVSIRVSDNKKRLFISDGGSITQPNGRIGKPASHLEYTVPEEPESVVSDASAEPSALNTDGEVVVKTLDWEELEVPENVSASTEKPDMLYLSVMFVCRRSGTLGVGFVGSYGEPTENELAYIERYVYESEEIQAVESEGTWNGTGDFRIGFSSGEIEIVSVRLSGNPLEEYRKQTDSAIKQSRANLSRIFEFLKLTKARLELVAMELNVLYGNDSILSGSIEGIEETLELHGKAISAASSDAGSAYTLASSVSRDLSAISGTLDSLSTSLSDLESRVAALEEAGEKQ